MIRSIDGKFERPQLVQNETRPPHQEQHQAASAGQNDRIELSSQAQELLRNPALAKRQRIEAGIETGFYSSPQVLHTVAQRLLGDLEHPNTP